MKERRETIRAKGKQLRSVKKLNLSVINVFVNKKKEHKMFLLQPQICHKVFLETFIVSQVQCLYNQLAIFRSAFPNWSEFY